MSAPVIPQRPARSSKGPPSKSPEDVPKVPPRPSRHPDRSISRDRDLASRSPLNESPFPHSIPQGFESSESLNGDLKPVKRAPSVPSLPLIGQEGDEYASLDTPPEVPREGGSFPQQTRNVASDLPLHAPKASDAAMNKISVVTGSAKPVKDDHLPKTPTTTKTSRPPSSATSHERPPSNQSIHLTEEEHGIPSFGITVPMYRNAGDVQAPTPTPGSAAPNTGVGFFHGSRPGTSDGRRRSMQGFHAPPGSYGLHGHGQLNHDRFEKDWYARHPEEVAKEEHALHVPASLQERPEYAMSSEELNQLVRETSRPSSGLGVHPEMTSVPSEVIGYMASEDYAGKQSVEKSKTRSSRPPSVSYVDSPLRKTFSAQDLANEDDEAKKTHLDPPPVRFDKVTGEGVEPSLESLGATGGNTTERGGWFVEVGDGVPILASDEVAKHPGAEYMQPAVSPSQMLSEDDYFSSHESDHAPMSGKSRSRSRPTSRTGSHDLSRFVSHEHLEGVHTPLEDIEEYEPLFEDDEKGEAKKLLTAADRLKRPELDRRRFPSQDIWEDTPTSLQLETTVDTPEEALAAKIAQGTKAVPAFESPEKEFDRKGETTEVDRPDVIKTAAKAKPKFGDHLREDRPGMQRFPSSDIWEDTPDSLRLETTVGEVPEADRSPPNDHPMAQHHPVVPPRPARPAKQAEAIADRKAPAISDRPKPQVPVRPAKSPMRDGARATRQEDDGAIAGKAKPAVPARPGATSKFASMKAGFLSDLNSRLGLGPTAPNKAKDEEEVKEEEADKAPLGDARRGRARGPARRKPAVSPVALAEGEAVPGKATWGIAGPWVVWTVHTSGPKDLDVTSRAGVDENLGTNPTTSAQLGERPVASPLATNTAGESLLDRTGAPATASGALAHPASATMDARAQKESAAASAGMRKFEEQRIGHAGDVPEPTEAEQAALTRQPTTELVAPSGEGMKDTAPAPETIEATGAASDPAPAAEVPLHPMATQPMQALMDDEDESKW